MDRSLTKIISFQLIVLSVLVALSYAAPQFNQYQPQYNQNQYIPIIRQEQDVNYDGSYQYR